jgi:hypothetical protein
MALPAVDPARVNSSAALGCVVPPVVRLSVVLPWQQFAEGNSDRLGNELYLLSKSTVVAMLFRQNQSVLIVSMKRAAWTMCSPSDRSSA